MPAASLVDVAQFLINDSILLEEVEKDQLLAKLPTMPMDNLAVWVERLRIMAAREPQILAQLPPEKLIALKSRARAIRRQALEEASEITSHRESEAAEEMLDAALATAYEADRA